MEKNNGEVRGAIHYRDLHKYKYQLVSSYSLFLPLNDKINGITYEGDYVELRDFGELVVRKGYAWDGASGPAIDTVDFMRGSLVHDALYQLIRLKILPESYRIEADRLLRKICMQDGMSRIRAWYVYVVVRVFGKFFSRPGTEEEEVFKFAPEDPYKNTLLRKIQDKQR